MSLTSGTRLGVYEITGALGAGGMGEVYRARDTQLNRSVAIKVLPELFAADHERLARFTREAQTLAALNHPNIAQIYGFENAASAGTRALVMELVEGHDLSVLIAQGPLPLGDALPIARQIADALEAAHDVGIIHRDLKPANIKVRSDGTVKVLDFGLAKAMDPAGSPQGLDYEDGVVQGFSPAHSPTLTARATQMGMIIGTAAYMAPEQAKGKAVDKRADIWAFGVVLYEMLTGKRAFEGEDISEVLASVLKSEPDWTALPATTPRSVRGLLARCLEREPRRRLRDIGDARLELEDVHSAEPDPPTRAQRSSRLWMLPWALTALTMIVAALVVTSRRSAPDSMATRLSVLAPPGTYLYPDSDSVAISPDGTMIAFITGSVSLSDTQLWVRSLGSMSSRQIEGGEHASLPFWSPDSRRIGFFKQTKLMIASASGGRAEVLTDAPNGRGGAWNASNVILYAPDGGGPLYRIAANGGTPAPVTTLDAAKKEFSHRFPTFLPDGKHFLYAALPGKGGRFEIFAGSLDDPPGRRSPGEGGTRTTIGSLDSAPVYADPGWLLSSRQGVLVAHPFDVRTLKLTGDAVQLPDEPTRVLDPAVAYTASTATSVSATGTLAYFSAPSTNTVAAWHDTDGKHVADLSLPAAHYETASISPDGARAIIVRSTSPSESALWLVDLTRGGVSQFSTGPGRNDSPVWSPDGARIVFTADRDGAQNLYVKRVDDAAPEELHYRSEVPFKGPDSWSPDGQSIVLTQLDAGTAQNLWLLPASGKEELKLLVRTPTRDKNGAPSPDGRWLAYASEETGRYELYVQSFPSPGHRQQVSQHGGLKAWWTRDGRQLLFIANDQRSLWRVDVEPGTTLRIGIPKLIATFPQGNTGIDATPDRKRFLLVLPERTGPGSLTVVHNWRSALTRER